MGLRTSLTDRLGIDLPIIQAPLGGGGDTPALTAAVSNAGGLGFIGAAYLEPEQIATAARAVRALTERPFGVNLFAPRAERFLPADPAPALATIKPFHDALGLQAPRLPEHAQPDFDAQFEAALESGARVFSFTFGVLSEAAIGAAKSRGMVVIGAATTVEEARTLERSGVDAVVAQGGEAGGHRGGSADAPLVGSMALVPLCADALSVPVIASGGIMDGRGLAAALALGAQAVQFGTAFLACEEAGISEAYRQALAEADETATRVTSVVSGRPARGIANRFMEAVEARGPEAILPFPFQNALTRPLRVAAAQAGRAEFLSLWAGQAAALARREPAAALTARIAAEAEAVLARLSS